MARSTTKVGDVFSVRISDSTVKYLQYIVSDLTQLNSDVIRSFKREYPLNADPDLSEVVKGEVEFYAHCVTKLGIELGYWEKVGSISDVGRIDHILFRDSGDYGNPDVRISEDWWVWKINEEQKRVGKLTDELQKTEIGLVINPESIVYRMRTGEFDFSTYPS